MDKLRRTDVIVSRTVNMNQISHKNEKHSGSGSRRSVGMDRLLSHLCNSSPSRPTQVPVKVVSDFEPQGLTELRATVGQWFTLLYQVKGWAFVRDLHGATGYVPLEYCRLRQEPAQSPQLKEMVHYHEMDSTCKQEHSNTTDMYFSSPTRHQIGVPPTYDYIHGIVERTTKRDQLRKSLFTESLEEPNNESPTNTKTFDTRPPRAVPHRIPSEYVQYPVSNFTDENQDVLRNSPVLIKSDAPTVTRRELQPPFTIKSQVVTRAVQTEIPLENHLDTRQERPVDDVPSTQSAVHNEATESSLPFLEEVQTSQRPKHNINDCTFMNFKDKTLSLEETNPLLKCVCRKTSQAKTKRQVNYKDLLDDNMEFVSQKIKDNLHLLHPTSPDFQNEEEAIELNDTHTQSTNAQQAAAILAHESGYASENGVQKDQSITEGSELSDCESSFLLTSTTNVTNLINESELANMMNRKSIDDVNGSIGMPDDSDICYGELAKSTANNDTTLVPLTVTTDGFIETVYAPKKRVSQVGLVVTTTDV